MDAMRLSIRFDHRIHGLENSISFLKITILIFPRINSSLETLCHEIYSVTFKSGKHAGYITSASSMFFTNWAAWGLTFSPIKRKQLPITATKVRHKAWVSRLYIFGKSEYYSAQIQVRMSIFADRPVLSIHLVCIVIFPVRSYDFFQCLSYHKRTCRVSHSRLNWDLSMNSTWFQCISSSFDVEILNSFFITWYVEVKRIK